MENNSEKEKFRESEERLERIAGGIEGDIERLKDLERRDQEELKEVREEIKELRELEDEESERRVRIFVNGVPEEVGKGEITYNEVVTFAFPDFPEHPERSYSVKYKKGCAEKPEGILPPGGKVKVQENMRFDVTYTGQS